MNAPRICAGCGGPMSRGVLGCVERPGAMSLADVLDGFVLEGDLEWLHDPFQHCPDCGADAAEVHHVGCEFSQCSVHHTELAECGCEARWLADQARRARPSWWRRVLRLRGPYDRGEIIRCRQR